MHLAINMEIDMTHTVRVFVNNNTKPKKCSLTARKVVGARLNEVQKQTAGLGFTDYEIVSGIDKMTANIVKKRLKSMLDALGCQIVPRKEL